MSVSLLNHQMVPLLWHGNDATQTAALQYTMIFISRASQRVLLSVQGTTLSEATGFEGPVWPYTNHQCASLHLVLGKHNWPKVKSDRSRTKQLAQMDEHTQRHISEQMDKYTSTCLCLNFVHVLCI